VVSHERVLLSLSGIGDSRLSRIVGGNYFYLILVDSFLSAEQDPPRFSAAAPSGASGRALSSFRALSE